MDSKPLRLIAAADEALGIGKSGRLPWELPNEFSWFVSQVDAVSDPSKKNVLIWGRGSAVSDSRPLPHCYRVCLSTTLSSVPAGTDFLCRDLASAVQLASLPPLSDHIETIWVLGGTRPFQEAWRYPNCDRIYLTNIMANFHCDTFFPDFDQDIFQLQDKFPGVPSEIQEENGIQYKFQVFQKVLSNDPEPRLQYA
ncbi:dihydrofolate reductase-like isoform X1 [Amblyraja radiata]|uniref:dihydrofolate reductase-like isoform X1 n=1 Tax=Amblyraja radiata TaxID=386614 RepID=UPI0014034166|nr:dihydrofolate reductase-like isoform X1 [Amblyraja radiata]